MQDVNFWSFTSAYPIAILCTLVPALINLSIFIYVSVFLPKNKSNNTFSFFVLFLFLWQATEGIMHICTDANAALIWYRVSGVPTIGIAVFEVLFALRFTGWYRRMPYTLYYLLLIFPAIIFAMFTVAGFDLFHISGSNFWHWIATPAPSLFNDLLYAWISLCSLCTLSIFFIHHLQAKGNIVKRRQSLLLLTGFAMPVIGGIIGEVIAPLIFGTEAMPITTALVTCFSVAALIAIRRYGMLDFSPRHQWEKILKTMNEGLVIVNQNNRIVYTNNKFNSLFGYTEEELHGEDIVELVSDRTSQEIMLDAFEERKKNIPGEYQVLADKKDGSKVWLHVSGFPYTDRTGQITGSVGVVTDITELMNTQIQLKNKINDLNLFFYKTSHDFKTPIASMQGLLECYDKDDNIDEFLHYAKLCIQNLSQIVGRVSQLSIIQQKQVIAQDINTKEYIDKIIRDIKTETRFDDRISIITELNVETMHSEKYLLQLIVKNLLENGVNYSDPGKDAPFVNIRISEAGGEYKIQVSDNGCGIPVEIQDKVFDMFYRGNDRSKGSGLGLYIVKSAVDKLHGKVSVKSELGQGTEFTVTIPVS